MNHEDLGADRSEVEFWNHIIEGQHLLEAISANRAAAIHFFGEAPVNRANPTELLQIAFARRILSMSDEAVALEMAQIDSTIDLLTQSGVIDEERLKFGDGVEAIREPANEIGSEASTSFWDVWRAAALAAYSQNSPSESEVSLMRRAAGQVVENAVRNQ